MLCEQQGEPEGELRFINTWEENILMINITDAFCPYTLLETYP